MNNILRVFPRKTSMTPNDKMVVVGDPGFWKPEAEEVHISVTFTWDIEEGYRLKKAWGQYYPDVKIGGPAIDRECGEFTPGMYLKEGVTITSRGCYRSCPWCVVPEREGKIKLLDVKSGYIVQDNNILATPRSHQKKVYRMLKLQSKAAKFAGGIDSRLVTDWVADQFRQLRISEVFFAADTERSLDPLAKAVEKLSFLKRNSNKMRCFVMIGYGEETIEQAEDRLKAVWDIGCVPFSQLYQPLDKYIEYPREWKRLNRSWSRPAAIRTMMKS